ncbi:NAD(P)/FAD-dependent oxidoreductase [Campylobacter lari]|uniref:NAD(P)-binding protein n=1 Tax=Campylobacter lari TaxID=201 RepID=A0A698FSZ6_CAMLA|nr:NAD(P)/FAD-dependent oxidoreductase [Campylobacter lari]ECW8954032.1 NAD(P)-binding protein [Campylobacter lari]MBT0793464.1 NAD(P)-binding protein [Campylobacter lari]MCR6536178.1 NAD(P)-binding protein [Campylobacter lari]MCR6537524.1 NAD(P)-binding protein [Campylobacter lari]MCR6548762.1 NAD(P)-binding protein [Campylobacter lari]
MQRRDFLNGMALTILAGMTPLQVLYGKEAKIEDFTKEYYPPKWLGLRGSNNASYEFAHMLRDGEKFDFSAIKPKQEYDLVVVGAGISGLAAACFYQNKFGKDKKILILDNHDDFGGHARRNEIELEDGTILSYGGSETFQSPKALYSKEVVDLLSSLGVDIDELAKRFDVNFYPDLKLSRGVYFSKSEFGVDKVVNGNPRKVICDDIPEEKSNGRSIEAFIGDFPLNDKDKKDLIALFKSEKDYLKGMDKKQRDEYVAKTSYKKFLEEKVKLSPQAVKFFEGMTDDFLALGIDAVSCEDARVSFLPGFDKLGLDPIEGEALAEMEEPYIHHCADGNATVARLMVRRLIPDVSKKGKDMDEITLAHFDYSKLDLAKNKVRLRLNSTVINVENTKDGALVTYINKGKNYRVKAKKVVMANYNSMIPYIVPSMPQDQKDALSKNVKTSLLHTKVIISNWEPFIKLGVHEIYSPKMPYARTKLDYPVDMGGYHHPRDPKKPICVHMVCSPLAFANIQGIDLDGMDARDRARVGRNLLFTMSFEEHEKIIRDQLQGMLGSAGFNHEKDIKAIVVNRWGHCYSYTENSLFDDSEEAQKTIELARKPFGNIVIANSDSDWSAYMHSAIDQAYRAVNEL